MSKNDLSNGVQTDGQKKYTFNFRTFYTKTMQIYKTLMNIAIFKAYCQRLYNDYKNIFLKKIKKLFCSGRIICKQFRKTIDKLSLQ